MKLQTSIPPRRDGTVRHTAKDGKTYVFSPGPDGDLVCDVDDPAVIAFLLKGDLFYPANPEDYDKALLIAGKPAVLEVDGEGDGATTGAPTTSGQPGDGDEGEADPEDDEPTNENAMPIEGNTPPAGKAKKAGGGKGK